METLFRAIVSMSTTAGWMILALIVLRPLLKKAPRWIGCALWALAAFRLVCPFSLESVMSLIPKRMPLEPTLNRAAEVVLPAMRVQIAAVEPAVQAVNRICWISVLSTVWLIGALLLAGYAIISYIRLLHRVSVSIRVGEKVYICDGIPTPFILGIASPKIYVPSEMPQQQLRYVLAHEQAHLRRHDNLWKPLGYAVLCMHWFNPLCWAAYVLFCRDMELACDEAVVRSLDHQGRKSYSAALLSCAVPHSGLTACPVAFGEVGVKQRIRSVLHYRKPAGWMVGIAVALCAVLACCFLTNPVQAEQSFTEEPEATTIPVFVETTVPDEEEVTANPLCMAVTNVNVRSAPSAEARAIGYLEFGDMVVALKWETVADVDWCYVRNASGNTGWVVNKYLTQADTGGLSMILVSDFHEEGTREQAKDTVLMKKTTIYSAPSTGAHVLAQAGAGEAVQITRMEQIGPKVWAYVECGQAMGWIEYDNVGEIVEAISMPVEQPVETATEAAAVSVAFAQDAQLYSSPSVTARVIAQCSAGDPAYVRQIEQIANTSWAYVECGMTMGWTECSNLALDDVLEILNDLRGVSEIMHDLRAENVIERAAFHESAYTADYNGAMIYFCDYIAACMASSPDLAESFVYFKDDASRSAFRANYRPEFGTQDVTGFQLNDNLWSIGLNIDNSPETLYSFVGWTDNRLYIFQNTNSIPEELTEGLDMTQYIRDGVYTPSEFQVSFEITTKLMRFNNPKQIKLIERSDYTPEQEYQYELDDIFTGTDTWQSVPVPENKEATAIIQLYDQDGSVAEFADNRECVIIIAPDGTQEAYAAAYTGSSLFDMVYCHVTAGNR